MTDRILSVDLGQIGDPTAIAIVEVARLATGQTHRSRRTGKIVEKFRSEYWVRHLEQPPLKTSYADIVARLGAIKETPEMARSHLVVDATGVGAPVTDFMRSAGLNPIAITLHGQDQVKSDEHGYRVPKRDIVTVMHMLLASGRLRIAEGMKLSETLRKEMQTYKLKFSKSGKDTYEAHKDSDHDDLVVAVAMACWYAERGEGRFGLWFEAPEPERGSIAWEQEEKRRMRKRLTRAGNERLPFWRKKPLRAS